MAISASALSFNGCKASSTSSATIEAADTILTTSSAYFPDGLTTTDPTGDTRQWTGPTYLLSRDTYRALMLLTPPTSED